MTDQKVGTAEDWFAARAQLLARDKGKTPLGDELAQLRRELRWVRVEEEYRVERLIPLSRRGAPARAVELRRPIFDRGVPARRSRPSRGHDCLTAPCVHLFRCGLGATGCPPLLIAIASENPPGAASLVCHDPDKEVA